MKSKKILIVISHLSIGGTEVQTLNLVTALIQNGFQVTVVCLFRNIPSVVSAYKEIGANVYIVSPQYNNKEIQIRYPKGWKLIKFIYTHLKKVIKMEHFHLVHVQYMPPASSVVLTLYYLLNIKNIIVTSHTMADIYPSLRLVHHIQSRCVRAFTCITQRAEESFFGSAQLYHPENILKKRNHFTIYNALPPYIHIREEKRNCKKEELTIGVVSRLEKIKGMDLVIPAFARVNRQYPHVKLLIVGDGMLRSTMEQQAQSLSVSDAITWVGRQTTDNLQACYDQIDILLMPSRSEGFGLTAIEGMARGCVVIAANVGGLPEVVRDREVGLLHQTESIEMMEEKINYLIKKRSTLQTLSNNAIKEVAKFSFEQYAALFTNLYQRI